MKTNTTDATQNIDPERLDQITLQMYQALEQLLISLEDVKWDEQFYQALKNCKEIIAYVKGTQPNPEWPTL